MLTDAIVFDDVHKRFSRQHVLRGLSLRVAPGEFFGLVGVNGAGKTTSLKGLLDFCDVDRGRIEIFGTSARRSLSRARLSFLPERFLPPYYLAGRDFLRYMARLQSVTWSEDAVHRMCAELDFDADSLAKPVREYSKGMAQKLGLMACFLAERELLVLDEPMSGLDPKARLLVKDHLLSRKDGATTVLFSTHMLADVEELCDRMGILHEGELKFSGTPAQCRSQFVADSLERAYLNCISNGRSETV